MFLNKISVSRIQLLKNASQHIWPKKSCFGKGKSFSTNISSTLKYRDTHACLIRTKRLYSLKFKPKEARGDFGKRPAKVSRAWRSALINLGMPLSFIGFFMYLVTYKPSWFNKGEETLQINTNTDNTAYVNKVREELWARKIRKQSEGKSEIDASDS